MCLREKIGPDPQNFNQRVSLGRNDLLIRTFPSSSTAAGGEVTSKLARIRIDINQGP